MYDPSTIRVLAIPPHDVNRLCWSCLLQHDPDRVREAHWIMRCIRRKQVKTVLVDRNIDELVRRFRRVDGLQEHATFVLVEELGRLIDVIVGAGVRPADNHDCEPGCFRRGGVVDAVVVDWWLKEVAVLL